jgi:hypothetical protein
MAAPPQVKPETIASARSGTGGLGASTPAAASKGTAPAAPTTAWKIADIGEDFSLDEAVKKAYAVAATYMNTVLNRDRLEVDVQVPEKEGLEAAKARVVDQTSGRVIKEYDGRQILTLYATDQKGRGVVVDGKV